MAVEAAGCLDGFELRTGLIRRLLMWGRQAGDGESVTSGSGRDPCLVAGTRPCPGRYSAGSAWPGRGPFEPQNPANPAECRVSLQCLAAASDPTPAGRSRTFFADPSARASRPSRPYRQMAETSKALTVGLLYNRLLTEFLISGRKILTLLIYYGHCLRVYLLLSVKDLRRERFAILSPSMVYILSQCSQYAQDSSSCGCDSRRSASLGIGSAGSPDHVWQECPEYHVHGKWRWRSVNLQSGHVRRGFLRRRRQWDLRYQCDVLYDGCAYRNR